MFGDITAKTLAAIREAQLAKDATTTGISTGLGAVEYNLELAGKLLFPTQTPLRNRIPRNGLGQGERGHGLAAHWRSIVNVSSAANFGGVSEGNRAALKSTQERDLTAAFKGIGQEDYVTYEADWAAEGWDDMKALAVKTTLALTMVEEEKMILWGNTSLQLGTTPTPTLTDAGGSGGGFGTTPFVFCVALTPWGQLNAGGTVAPTIAALTNVVGGQSSRASAGPYSNTDTINLGNAKVSAQGSVAITSGHNVTAVVAGVKGACAYAWYAGSTTGAANCYLAAITTIPTVTLTAPGNSGNQAANAAAIGTDYSTNALAFDGLITQALSASAWANGGIFTNLAATSNPPTGGGYYLSNAGNALTGGPGTVVEIDNALKWYFDNYRIWPDSIFAGSKQAAKITSLLVGESAPMYTRYIERNEEQGVLQGGFFVSTYLNKFAMGGPKPIDIFLHPFMPDSWLYFHTQTIADKYPISNVPECNRMKVRKEYYQKAWPEITRKYEYGVYVDEVLQCYTPFANGVLADLN